MGRESPTMPWPQRSQDITPCDFFLWDFSSLFYAQSSIDELIVTISNAFQLITKEMLQKVFQNYRVQLERFLSKNAKHIKLYDNN